MILLLSIRTTQSIVILQQCSSGSWAGKILLCLKDQQLICAKCFELLQGTSQVFNLDFIVHELHIKQFAEDAINANANIEQCVVVCRTFFFLAEAM